MSAGRSLRFLSGGRRMIHRHKDYLHSTTSSVQNISLTQSNPHIETSVFTIIHGAISTVAENLKVVQKATSLHGLS